MDIHKDSVQISRLSVVETGRRRRWTRAEKLRIVEESFAEPRQASATARRYGISNQLLFSWRKAYGGGRQDPVLMAAAFVPARIVPEPSTQSRASGAGLMTITLAGGLTITVGADVDADALRRVLDVVRARSVDPGRGEDR